MSNKNEVLEYLIDQLRQQLTNSQCEDLSNEVQSLKNQLRDASAQLKELHLALVRATGDSEAYKLIRKGGYIRGGQNYVVGEHATAASVNCRCTPTPVLPEQSGCRKEDTQVRDSWIAHGGGACPVPDDAAVDIKFRNGEVESNTKALWWSWGTNGGPYEIVAYRVAKPGCEHDWYFYDKGASMMCKKCGLKK